MPRISPQRREEQRRRIVLGMLEAIRDKGIAATTMGDVIERSGLSAGAIYGYYPGKEAILLALAQEIITERAEELEIFTERQPVPPPLEVVRLILTTMPDVVRDGGPILQIWGHATAHEDVREVAADVMGGLQERLEAYLRAWFAQEGSRDPEADARIAAPVLLGISQGYLIQVGLLGRRDPEVYLRGLDLLLAPTGATTASAAAGSAESDDEGDDAGSAD